MANDIKRRSFFFSVYTRYTFAEKTKNDSNAMTSFKNPKKTEWETGSDKYPKKVVVQLYFICPSAGSRFVFRLLHRECCYTNQELQSWAHCYSSTVRTLLDAAWFSLEDCLSQPPWYVLTGNLGRMSWQSGVKMLVGSTILKQRWFWKIFWERLKNKPEWREKKERNAR